MTMKQTMSAMVIEKFGKDVPMVEKEVPIPAVGPNDVLVKVHAASLNPIDFKIRDGGALLMLFPFKTPLIMGNDFAGEVVQLGKNVRSFNIGDKVYGRPSKTRIGTFAEYFATDQYEVSHMPAHLSYVEAASIPLVGLTSYQALNTHLNLQSGDKVFIPGGAGGIGTFAIQLAKSMGLYVATTASDNGYDLVQSLGADEIINYKKNNYQDLLKDYDGVFDTRGDKDIENEFKVLKKGKKVVSIAATPDGQTAKVLGLNRIKQLLLSIAARKIHKLAKQYHVHYEFFFVEPSRKELEMISKLIEAGHIKPIIDRTYPFHQAQDALAYLESGRAKGKVVISMDELKEELQ